MSERFSGQIAVHKTPAKLLEFIDNLNPAPLADYASIHAGATRPCERDGKRVYSTIRLVAQDYSIKGTLSVRARANISPAEVLFLATVVKNRATDFFEHETIKIFGEADKDGLCSVTKLRITRFRTGERKVAEPWRVDIENGKGVKGTNENGGTFCQEGTYVREKNVFIKLSDFEFFSLITAVERYMHVWEGIFGAMLVREGRHARDASETAHHGRRRHDD